MNLLHKLEEYTINILMAIKTLAYNSINNKIYKYINYGEEKKQYYLMYNECKKNNFIFFIHGGGWWHGTPKLCTGIARFFLNHGYNVIMPSYRLVPFNRYPTQIEDIFSAYKHFNEHFNEENKDVIIVAYSAGCELAVNLILNENINKNIKKVILLAGTLDFNKCTSKRSLKLIKNYIGKNREFKDINPINLINKKIDIPILCVHGKKDPLISFENSVSFINKINYMGGKGFLITIKNKHHCDMPLLIMNNKSAETKQILNFIKNEISYD